MKVISATEKQDIDSFLTENKGVAVLLLYKQGTHFDPMLLETISQLVQQTDVTLIKIDVQKSPYFSKCTNISQRPSFALVSKTCDNIIDYKSQGNQTQVKQLFQMARELKLGGASNQQAILGKQYKVTKID